MLQLFLSGWAHQPVKEVWTVSWNKVTELLADLGDSAQKLCLELGQVTGSLEFAQVLEQYTAVPSALRGTSRISWTWAILIILMISSVCLLTAHKSLNVSLKAVSHPVNSWTSIQQGVYFCYHYLHLREHDLASLMSRPVHLNNTAPNIAFFEHLCIGHCRELSKGGGHMTWVMESHSDDCQQAAEWAPSKLYVLTTYPLYCWFKKEWERAVAQWMTVLAPATIIPNEH